MRIIPNKNGIPSSILIPNIIKDDKSVPINCEFIARVSESMKKIDFTKLAEGITHGEKKSYMPVELNNATHVRMRIDRIKKPFEALYAGPYKLIKLDKKTATIQLEDGKKETVSIKRIKPARFALEQKKKKKVRFVEEVK